MIWLSDLCKWSNLNGIKSWADKRQKHEEKKFTSFRIANEQSLEQF